MTTAEVFKAAEGHVSVWIEQEDTVHLKADDEHGDPVELTAAELKSLIDELTRLHAIVETRGISSKEERSLRDERKRR